MTTAAEPLSAVTGPPAGLDEFFGHVRAHNPFAVNRVVPSAEFREDADTVHERPFARLVELAGRVQTQHTGIGAVLWGEAGIGKSHVLARLGQWTGPDHEKAVFVLLSNLQAGPEHLPRSLLKCVVSVLTRGRTADLCGTRLYRMVNAAVRHALQSDRSRTYSWAAAGRAYQRLVDDLCDRTPARAALVDRDAYSAMFQLYRSAYQSRAEADDGVAALAVRWLCGDWLDAAEAKALGVAAGRIADDEQIRKVLIALAQVASYRPQPFIVCLDQADNLEPGQAGALARFLHALLDSASNLFVVTSGVRATLMRWKDEGVIQQSTWDRLGQYEVELQRVGVSEARQIVQAYLQPLQERFLSLEPVKNLIQTDYLFPLGERWAREFLADKIDVRPRDVITWAREGWQREQQALEARGGPEWLGGWKSRADVPPAPVTPPVAPAQDDVLIRIDELVEHKVREHVRQRLDAPDRLPSDAANLAGLLGALMDQCRSEPGYRLSAVERPAPPKHGQSPAFDLILRQRSAVDGKERRTGVHCLVVGHRTAMAAHLRRLEHSSRPLQRLVVVTDERLPLDPAAKGAAYLSKLRQRHQADFHLANLSFQQYAELDALQAVVGAARSGDLEIDLPGGPVRRVTEQEVIASHHRRRRFAAHPLLGLLLGAPDPAADGRPVEPAHP